MIVWIKITPLSDCEYAVSEVDLVDGPESFNIDRGTIERLLVEAGYTPSE